VHFRGVATNGDEYCVTYDETTGNLSGYAWTSSGREAMTGTPLGLGWLSFNESDATHPAPQLVGGAMRGWARFLSYGGGWDGWVKLAKDPADAGASYGVTQSGNDFLGHAWGSEVAGWLSFSSRNCDTDGDGLSNDPEGDGSADVDGDGRPDNCPDTSTKVAQYRVTLSLRDTGGSLYVTLSAAPSSGGDPLEDVDLTARVFNAAAGDILYEFDCENDGALEASLTTPLTEAAVADLCTYSPEGKYTAFVRVTDADGNTSFDEITISVLRVRQEVRPE
jgi:hypothetical protein